MAELTDNATNAAAVPNDHRRLSGQTALTREIGHIIIRHDTAHDDTARAHTHTHTRLHAAVEWPTSKTAHIHRTVRPPFPHTLTHVPTLRSTPTQHARIQTTLSFPLRARELTPPFAFTYTHTQQCTYRNLCGTPHISPKNRPLHIHKHTHSHKHSRPHTSVHIVATVSWPTRPSCARNVYNMVRRGREATARRRRRRRRSGPGR